MNWFGKSWGAPICNDVEHVSTPVGERCHLCTKPITETDQGLLIPLSSGVVGGQYAVGRLLPWHIDCFLDSVGIRPGRA